MAHSQRLSRSKIDLFINCPRCFYFDLKLKVKRVPGPPFSINSAIDTLLKKEFDVHRAKGTPHPLMSAYGLDAVPLAHDQMDLWRESLRGGIRYHYPETNLIITGGVDDVWVNPSGEFIIVDYKSTAKSAPVEELGDAPWHDAYRRQMEIYQWLFRKNNFKVSDTGYFVYCTGRTDATAFDGKVEFSIHLIPYTGKTNWIDGVVSQIWQTLQTDQLPEPNPECPWCAYRSKARDYESSPVDLSV